MAAIQATTPGWLSLVNTAHCSLLLHHQALVSAILEAVVLVTTTGKSKMSAGEASKDGFTGGHLNVQLCLHNDQ